MQKLNKPIIKGLNFLGKAIFNLKVIVKSKSPIIKEKLVGFSSKLRNAPSNLISKIKRERGKKRKARNLKKSVKKLFRKNTVVKVIIIVATASMLLPLVLPFLG